MKKSTTYKKTKLWLSMSALSLAGVAALGGCGPSDDTDPTAKNAMPEASQSVEPVAVVTAHEGEGGEGEGGEGEGAPIAIDLSTNDAAYLTQLGLIRGHLLVGVQLYHENQAAHAKTHMKHPKSELYSDLEPALTARGSTGFADALATLTDAVVNDAPAAEVDAAYAKVVEGIAQTETLVSNSSKNSPRARLESIVGLLTTAADEYAIGIVDGKPENLHEYQDAYGFTRTASEIAAAINTENDAELADAMAQVKTLISGLDPAWPTLVPTQNVNSDASALYGAAARVELIASGID